MELIDSSSEYLKQGATFLITNKDQLLKGFGLSMGIIFLIMGATYVASSFLFKKVPCDEKLALYGYVMGGLYFVGAFSLLALDKENKWAGVLFVVAAAAAFFVRLYGLWLMLNEEGMLCRAVGGSKLWLIFMVLALANLAGLGKFII